jgi:hypothetical protein
VSDLIAVSDLIGDIYDAALDPALWPLVLERSFNILKLPRPYCMFRTFICGKDSSIFHMAMTRISRGCIWKSTPESTRWLRISW